jgi:hypothetical protein
VVPETEEAGSAETPTLLPDPSPTAEFTPTALPPLTVTLPLTSTAAPGLNIPPADIEITTPGALSKVVSPIPVRALLVPGANGRVTVELLGEDNRLLARQIVTLNGNLGRKAGLVVDLEFEISAPAELGRLVIWIEDAFGREQALSSVDLLLLSTGAPDYNAVVDLSTPILIQEPQPGSLVQGGTLIVSGIARPGSEQPLMAELIAEDGKNVGFRLVEVAGGLDSEHRVFVVELTYTVSEPTWARLILRERSDRIPGTIYLTSLEVYLNP